jgi:hypothetical protein
VRDTLAFGGLDEATEHDLVHDGTPREYGTFAELDLAVLLSVQIRVVGRVGDIDHDRHVRSQLEAARARPTPRGVSDLLLRRGHGDDFRGGLAFGDETQRLQRDDRADPVVDRTGSHDVGAELEGIGADHGYVPDRHPFPRLLAARRADIDPKVLQLNGLLAVRALDEVDGPSAYDPGDGPVGAEDLYTLTHQHLGVPAPDFLDVQKALIVNVVDHQADLIDVTGEHHPGTAPSPYSSEAAAVDVAPSPIGKLIGQRAPDRRRLRLEAGWPSRLQETAEALARAGTHAFSVFPLD